MATTDETFFLPNATYGFIGIGVMGWPMAQSLRRRMPKSSALVICELNKSRRDNFIAETEGLIKVAESPKEVTEQAVSSYKVSYKVIQF
jgi:3-hydroxyisobutyrate/3-hydroxypropionate dehydrogenase